MVRFSELDPLIDVLPLPVFLVDVCRDDVFRILRLNRAHCRVTGLEETASRHKTVAQLLGDPAAARTVDERYAACVDAKEDMEYEEELVFGDRRIAFTTRLSFNRDPETGRDVILGVANPLLSKPSDLAASDLLHDLSILRMNLAKLGTALSSLSDAPAPGSVQLSALRTVARMTQQSADDLSAKLSRNDTWERPDKMPGTVQSLHRCLAEIA
ncbi:MAG: PAS domain-containing protein [Pseudomonadota bacterium]